MQKKKNTVTPIPAEVKALRYNASTPREEALIKQRIDNQDQVDFMKIHHGGKRTLHTVPQFHTGVPCTSGKCGNESSRTANINMMTSKKNGMYDSDVIPANKINEFMKKGGRKHTKSTKSTKSTKKNNRVNIKKGRKSKKNLKKYRKRKGKSRSRKSK